MGTNKKAGWLIDYDGTQFIPITCVDEIYNHSGSKIFGRVLEDGRNYSLGSGSKPIYIKNGVFEESNNNIAHSKRLMYMANGVLTPSEANEGSNIKPVYLYQGQITQSDATIGSATKPIWLNGGEITVSNGNVATDEKTLMYMSGGELLASDATVGGSKRPIYLNGGTLTACDTTIGANDKFIYINTSGNLTASTATKGSGTKLMYLNAGTFTESNSDVGDAYTPVYLSDGVLTAGNNLNYTVHMAEGPATGDVALQLLRNGNTQDSVVISPGSHVNFTYDTTNGNWMQITADDSYFHMYVDDVLDAENTPCYDPYVGLYDDTDNCSGSFQLIGGSNVTIYHDGAGGITISSSNTTYSKATSSTLGLVKIGYSTDATNRNYAVALDANGKMYVNVPWTDNNTTYTLSAGSSQGQLKLNSATAVTATGLGTTGTPTFFMVTAGTITATTQFNSSSDVRLKENFRPFNHGDIFNLPLYKFDYIDGGKDRIGCMAQDLQKICPEIVHENEDGYLTIEESKIVYLLLDKMKEMQKEIDELKGV